MPERGAFRELKKLLKVESRDGGSMCHNEQGGECMGGFIGRWSLDDCGVAWRIFHKKIDMAGKMVLEEEKEAMHARFMKGKHVLLLYMVPAWEAWRPLV